LRAGERANAVSLVNPGIAAAVQGETATGTTEVRWASRLGIGITVGTAHWHRVTGVTATGDRGETDNDKIMQTGPTMRACFCEYDARCAPLLARFVAAAFMTRSDRHP